MKLNDVPLFNPPRLTGKYLHKTLASGWLTSGPRCQELQEATAAFLKVRPEQVVLAASATAGWQAVVDMSTHDNEVDYGLPVIEIIDATWPGMLQVAEQYGIRGSCGPWRYGIRLNTDIGGRRLSDEDVERDAARLYPKGTVFVHDACHSWQPCPAADFGLVSFYPTKLVPGAEGGAVVCKRAEDAEQLRLWLYCGLRPGAAGRGESPAVPGRKANMTDVTAALNLEALGLAPKYIEDIYWAWERLALTARELDIPYRDQPVRPYLFQIDYDFAKGPPTHCPWARNFSPAPLLTLPCFPGLSKAQARDILTPFAAQHTSHQSSPSSSS